jgi:hypothetical protein
MKKSLGILDELDIIKHIKDKLGIIDHNIKILKISYYEKPKLKIVDDFYAYGLAIYSRRENKIVFSRKALKEEIDKQSKDYQEIEGIKYLKVSSLLYPFYINEGNTIEALTIAIILLSLLHESWHSFDEFIFKMLIFLGDSTIKNRDRLYKVLTTHYGIELRASAFEVIMYYLLTGFYKDKRVYISVCNNISTTCRKYLEELGIIERSENIYTDYFAPYTLGRCYGNIIVAKYKSSLEKSIDKIIDDLVYLDKEKAIEVIKNYVYNPDKLLQD